MNLKPTYLLLLSVGLAGALLALSKLPNDAFLATGSKKNVGNRRQLQEATTTMDYSRALRDPRTVVQKSILVKKHTSSSNDWAAWHIGDAPIQAIDGQTCDWITFKASNGRTAPFCGYGDDEIISKSVRQYGRWYECDDIVTALKEQQEMHQNSDKNKPLIYVDVGANIGTCSLSVLLETNANVIAFEPHPNNQFHFTSTMAALNSYPEFQNRVTLLPIGVGSEKSWNIIQGVASNMGGTRMVGQQAPTGENAFKISIERVDDVLDASVAQIDFMKIDVEGFECHAIEGMVETLRNTKMLNVEVFDNALKLNGCSAATLLDKIRKNGFDLYLEGKLLMTDNEGLKLINTVQGVKKSNAPSVTG